MTSPPALQIATDQPGLANAAMRPTNATAGDRAGAHRGAIVAVFGLYVVLLAVASWWSANHLPDRLSVALFGRLFSVNNLHSRLASNGVLVFAILPSVLWLECLIVGWPGSSIRQLLLGLTPSNKTDLTYFFAGQTPLTGATARLMTFGVSMLSGIGVHDWIRSRLGVSIDPTAMPFAAQIAVYTALYTFLDYWTHRLDHSRHLWPLHRYHHSADDFCVVTAARAHPASFTFVFLINMPMAISGASPAVMVDVNALVLTLGFVIHSRIDSDFGWIGRWVIQSPVHHRLHHILDLSEPVGHFSMAPIWDRVFGTWRGDADQSLVIGVDTPYRHGAWLAPDLARDYWHFWKGLYAPLSKLCHDFAFTSD